MYRTEAIEFAKEQQEIFGGKMGEFLEFVKTELSERRGKWEFIRMDEDRAGNGFYKCSCCGKGDIHAPEVKVSYCWNCGAKMEGADDE